MPSSRPRTVCIFTSDAFKMDWPDGADVSELKTPWGHDLAEAIAQSLLADSPQVVGPHEDDDGWEISVLVHSVEHILFIHWAPLGARSEDHWVIQIRTPAKGILGSKPALDENRLSIIRIAVERALKERQVEEVDWLSDEEFKNIY